MSKPLPPHPMQPLVVVGDRVRFRANKIVKHLLDRGGLTLNDVIAAGFDQDELDHFYQLIGHSVDGYDELVGSDVISEKAAKAAAHVMCAQFGTTYSRCLDEESCPVHAAKKR